MRVPALLLEIARHLGSYMELGAAAVAEYRSAWIRRLVFALLAVVLGLAGLATLWLAGLVALWDTQWRLVYVTTSAVVLLVLAGVAAYGALAWRTRGLAAGVLKSELNKDLELFQQWKSTL